MRSAPHPRRARKDWVGTFHQDTSLGPFEQHNDTLATVGAHTDNCAATGAHGEEFLDTLAEIAGPRSGKRMANGDGAAIWIDALPGKCAEVSRDAGLVPDPILVLECRDVCLYLRSEGFVDLPQINVVIT